MTELLNKLISIRDTLYDYSLTLRRVEHEYTEIDRLNLDIDELLYVIDNIIERIK